MPVPLGEIASGQNRRIRRYKGANNQPRHSFQMGLGSEVARSLAADKAGAHNKFSVGATSLSVTARLMADFPVAPKSLLDGIQFVKGCLVKRSHSEVF